MAIFRLLKVKYYLVILFVFLQNILQGQSIISVGGGLGYNHCFYLNRDVNSAISNPEFQLNMKAFYYSQSIFFIGIQTRIQKKGIRVFVDKSEYDFSIYENRVGLLAGMNASTIWNPFFSLSVSNYRNDMHVFEQINANYYVPDNKFTQLNPAFEIGCNIITGAFSEKKLSLITSLSVRYTPLSMFREGDKLNFMNEYNEMVTTPFYNKMLDVCLSMTLHFNKKFKQN